MAEDYSKCKIPKDWSLGTNLGKSCKKRCDKQLKDDPINLPSAKDTFCGNYFVDLCGTTWGKVKNVTKGAVAGGATGAAMLGGGGAPGAVVGGVVGAPIGAAVRFRTAKTKCDKWKAALDMQEEAAKTPPTP